MAEPAPTNRFEFSPYDPVAAARIGTELGIAAPVATLLARRGIDSPAVAREFLTAGVEHDVGLFPALDQALELIRATIAAGGRITVHGDYDADGVCATAILVEALRAEGADCDWFIPSRLDDGYGLDDSLPERMAERGTALVITVDCGIGSAPVISALDSAGIAAIVTDHHALPAVLPDCPVLHPAIGYPFPGLCGAGVAAKLAEALRGNPSGLDLAAIATIADSVPLLDENRRIVREGLRLTSTVPRPGLRTLMATAKLAPERLSARDVAFRLAPRINAAGRLYRADAAVELLLTPSIERAAEIAAELDRVNGERREIESEVVAEAQRQATEQASAGELAALVLAAEGWHRGVVGIAASRLVDRHRVPVLMIAIDGDGLGTGSGRSVPGVDLLAALERCGDLLNRFGGHTGAAGLEIDAARIPALRERFSAAVAAQVGARPALDAEPLDGVLGVAELDLDLARGIEQLAPFGQGNPEPRFLVCGAAAEDVRSMGEEGRHARLMLRSGVHRADAVAFGAGDAVSSWAGTKLDAVVRLEVNDWNGAVSARSVIDSAFPALASIGQPCCLPAGDRASEYLALVADRLACAERPSVPQAVNAEGPPRWDGSSRPALAALADLVTSQMRVIVVTADARRRGALGGYLARLTARPAAMVCSRCAGPLPPGRPLVTDWATLAASSAPLSAEVLAAVDPAPDEAIEAAALAGIEPAAALFQLWGSAEVEFALASFRHEWDTRGHAAAIYRALAAFGSDLSERDLAQALGGERAVSRTPAAAARALRVLADVGLVAYSPPSPAGGVFEVRVVSSAKTDLDRSQAYRRFCADHQAGESFLSRQHKRAA